MDQFPDEIILRILEVASIEKSIFGNLRSICRKFETISRDKCFEHLITCGQDHDIYNSDHIGCIRLKYKKELNRELELSVDIQTSFFNHLNVVKFLVNESNVHDFNECSIRNACTCGNVKVVQYLVSIGADIHVEYEYPIRVASRCGKSEVVKYLIECGVDVHTDHDCAIRYFAVHGNLETVEYLVEKGADIHVRNDSPIKVAASEGRLDVVRFLVEKGADCRDAILWASNFGRADVVKYLISATDDRYKQNKTAIVLAGMHNHKETVKELVESGISKRSYDKLIEYEWNCGNTEFVKMLTSYGGNINDLLIWIYITLLRFNCTSIIKWVDRLNESLLPLHLSDVCHEEFETISYEMMYDEELLFLETYEPNQTSGIDQLD